MTTSNVCANVEDTQLKKLPQVGDLWYRFENQRYAPPVDEWGDPIWGARGEHKVHRRVFKVVGVTPKGVWLTFTYGKDHFAFDERDKRFVLLEARKRYACPTIEEAKESFIARKTRQARIYRARMEDAEEAIRIINKEKFYG